MQVRIGVAGARGDAKLSVPVPAVALKALRMTRGLGALLFGLMVLIAVALVSIVAGAVREATLEPGVAPHKRARIATLVACVLVGGLLALGNAWWNAEASDFAKTIDKPWRIDVTRDGCQLTLRAPREVLLDHGHEMHLFLIRVPGSDQMVHLHPDRVEVDILKQTLPSLPAGHYQVFGDIVWNNGFPITGTAELRSTGAVAMSRRPRKSDDSAWSGTHVEPTEAQLPDGGRMIWDRPPTLHANVAMPFRFHVVDLRR